MRQPHRRMVVLAVAGQRLQAAREQVQLSFKLRVAAQLSFDALMFVRLERRQQVTDQLLSHCNRYFSELG